MISLFSKAEHNNCNCCGRTWKDGGTVSGRDVAEILGKSFAFSDLPDQMANHLIFKGSFYQHCKLLNKIHNHSCSSYIRGHQIQVTIIKLQGNEKETEL